VAVGPVEPEHDEDLDEDDEGEWGSWELRAISPISAAEVAELPEPLQHWVRRMTDQAVDLFESVEEEEPTLAAIAAHLKRSSKRWADRTPHAPSCPRGDGQGTHAVPEGAESCQSMQPDAGSGFRPVRKRGIAFSTFAVPTIAGEIKRHFRDHAWSVRVPRDLQELALKVERVASELSLSLRRQPTVAEIADAVGASDEDVLEALEAARAYEASSLQSPLGDDDRGDTLGESIALRGGSHPVRDR